MEALRGTVERLAATGQLAPEVGDALRAGFARWDAAGRPRSDPAAWLAQLGLPPLWISQLLQWRQLVEEELAATDTYDPHELSGSARLTKFLRAGPFARSSQLQGVMLGRYRVEDELARGGMGVVLRARDTVSGAVVALKVLLAGEEAEERARKRFQREAEVAARLDHPGLVRILDFGSVDQLLYLVMELIEGPFLTFRGRSPREVAALIAQVARAIGHAHAQGIVHRDLKPRNVLLRPDGSIVVTDFGLVRDLAERSSLTQSGFALGTPHYMSPEQVIGSPTGPPTDVYALGVMLYEGLAGRTPHSEHSSISLFHAIREVEPDRPGLSRPDLPRELEAICMRALAKDPARRYPHGDALASDLEAFLAGQRTVAQAALGRRRAGLALAGTAALVAAGVGGALLAGRGGGPGPAPSPSLAQGRSATPSPAATAPSASPASSPSPTPNPPPTSPPPPPRPPS
ncbi:MAG: serine/threonine-protein kinase, partial [Planctomycetota bacterium]